MPRPEIDSVMEFVPLTLDELAKELVAIGVPEDAALNLAAAAYFYCPLPSILQSQWSTTIGQLGTLAYAMRCLQAGEDGVNPDFVPALRHVAALIDGAKVVLRGEAKPRLIRDGDRNVNALEDVDGEIYATSPVRVRSLFLLLAVELLHQQGGMTKEAAYRTIVAVIQLLEGKLIAPSSVRREYRRANREYVTALPSRQIDLSRIRKVLANRRGRYVAVSRKDIKVASAKMVTPAVKEADASDCGDGESSEGEPPKGKDCSIRWKRLPKCVGPGGVFDKWARTGEPPNPDEWPFWLDDRARKRLWFDYDGSSTPPVLKTKRRRQAEAPPKSRRSAPRRTRRNRAHPK